MENPQGEPEEILLENLEREFSRLNFLVDARSEALKRELEISIKAENLSGKSTTPSPRNSEVPRPRKICTA